MDFYYYQLSPLKNNDGESHDKEEKTNKTKVMGDERKYVEVSEENEMQQETDKVRKGKGANLNPTALSDRFDVPGRLTPGMFSTFGSLIGLMMEGHNCYKKMMEKYKSTVFRMHLFEPRTMVCDHEAVQYLFDSTKFRYDISG